MRRLFGWGAVQRTTGWAAVVLLSLALVAAACGDDGDDSAADTVADAGGQTDSGDSEEIDYEEVGLWNDEPCDPAAQPLHVGIITTFETQVISLGDSAVALEAAADAFNARGGANGSCVEVTTCDDGGNLDQAVECVRTLKSAGVVVTVNDQNTAGNAEVSAGLAEAGIPRVGSNISNVDWDDPNAYPLDAAGTGYLFMLPRALIDAGVSEIGLVRVDRAGASAINGLLSGVFEGEAAFPFDVPVPASTTDYSQFILGAEDAGVGGVALALGEQEAAQVVRAGQQLGTDLVIGAALGTFSHGSIADLGDFAEQLVFVWSFPPATANLPAYDVLRDDLAASGEEALQTEHLKASPMRSWIGLYGLLRVVRDAGMRDDFSGESVSEALRATEDVPMLGIFGDEDWTPDTDHPGLFKRAGMNHWASYRWDTEAEAPEGLEGNWVEVATLDLDEVLCGSPLGAPPEEC